ncbi:MULTISPECIES: carbohydrate porin [Cupriavidus]|jgi:LamB porin|uniref:Maltoporin n=1 Tax=Cupriavidus metallidurans TaxID=119219 RepID=A0A2L0XBV3_9BURK|nr:MULTISPECIES: carbohydrate porin [Cupriavidus]AVA37489.1 maltoporin [Cupriavidus metallidurans]KWR85897.1 maltoporin [Cupriavidus sp. SHE]QBP11496.1 maltoporin [Cupriavidus metallidurans]QWC88552.1 carbohydrate porin [Cupriavidus metallidurans]
MLLSALRPHRLLARRRLTFAVLAAWGLGACAHTGNSVSPPPFIAESPVPPAASVMASLEPAAAVPEPVAAPAGSADPLGDLILSSAPTDAATKPAEAASPPEASPPANGATSPEAATPPDSAKPVEATNAVDPDFVGPPDSLAPPPPPPPPLVLFPRRLGEFPAQAAAPQGEGTGDPASAQTPSDVPPVLRSQLPADNLAGDSVWQLGYSGRAAVEDRSGLQHACAGGGTPSAGFGRGLACTSSGEVKIRESLMDMGGGTQVQLVAQAKGTDTTSVNGNAAAVDPYALVQNFYTSVSGLSGTPMLQEASVWAGRRDSNPFLMSSGLLPPSSPSMRFGVDNAKVGDFGLSYQYTARNELNGAKLPSYHTVRSAPIGTNDKGSVQVGFTRVEAMQEIENSGGAWWASAMHEQKGVLYGTNRLGVQYGQGSRVAMTGYSGMGNDLSRVRVSDSVEWKSRSGLAGSVESSLQLDHSGIGTLQWAATRVRPAFVANDQFRLTFEVAHDQISSGFGVGGQRTAFTVAPTLTLGKSAGNANLRAFYTYSRANDVDGITFASPADAWASQTSGSIFGVQLNRRW